MALTPDADGHLDVALLALAALAVVAGSTGFFLAPGYRDVVYYALVTVGALALAVLIAKNRL